MSVAIHTRYAEEDDSAAASPISDDNGQGSDAVETPAPEIDAAAVARLMGYGFGPDACRHALVQHQGNENEYVGVAAYAVHEADCNLLRVCSFWAPHVSFVNLYNCQQCTHQPLYLSGFFFCQ